MSSLESQSPLNPHKHTHSPSFPPLSSLGYLISGKEIEDCGLGSPQFFPVIHAHLAGLPWFPVPSAVSPRDLQFLIQTFSCPPARVLSPLSFPARFLLLPKPCGKGCPKPHVSDPLQGLLRQVFIHWLSCGRVVDVIHFSLN